MSKQPNFLIFLTDQHRADHLGCYGNVVVKTPNIDALAAKGSRFDRAYVANPVCMPNRGSMMTGRMPSIHGGRGNGVPLPLDSVTFADVLADVGYRTALIGKSHLQNMEDKPSMLPRAEADPNQIVSTRYPEARVEDFDSPQYSQELRSNWDNPKHGLTLPYYGFQEVFLCNNHADECFGDYSRWLQAHHPEMVDRVGRKHGVKDANFVAPQAWHTQLSEEQYPTHYVAQQASEWLVAHQRAHAEQPFALVCSFPDPHHPWTPPGKYWDMYDPQDIELPLSAKYQENASTWVNWLSQDRSAGRSELEGQRMFAANEREIREIIALTYGMITNIDDRIGMVMQALRSSGADANTVVVFTSDHGDLMGDHGLMLKGPLHYQGLIRVPFIWREPSPGANSVAVRNDLVSSIDLAATILIRANVGAPNGVQGKPLFNAVGAPKESGRAAVLIEECQQRVYLGFDRAVQVRTLVTHTHRISVFREGKLGELYDLTADPQEQINLWDAPQALDLKCELLDQLVRSLVDHADASPLPTRVA